MLSKMYMINASSPRCLLPGDMGEAGARREKSVAPDPELMVPAVLDCGRIQHPLFVDKGKSVL